MEQESQMIQGTVLAVIYQNPENGYCVLKVRTEQGETVTVVGTIPMSVVGERLAIVGKWTRHQSFGQQFEAEFLERLMPETTSEILAFCPPAPSRASARGRRRRSSAASATRA